MKFLNYLLEALPISVDIISSGDRKSKIQLSRDGVNKNFCIIKDSVDDNRITFHEDSIDVLIEGLTKLKATK